MIAKSTPRPQALAHRRRGSRRSPWVSALALAAALVAGVGSPKTAAAWDPSQTHLGIVDTALRRSAVHLRWMASSELTRGVFTPLRIDPERLTPGERRFLQAAILRASDATGSRPLGGPGSCPGDEAPAVSQRYCVENEHWQMSAMAWIELGVLAELSPSAREVHHFIDPKDPGADSWSDPELPRWILRLRLARRNGAPLAGSVNRTNFDGHGASAVAWLKDSSDVIAPPRLYAHLERAYLEGDAAARAHHLAMALVCVGALLHVAQDLSVPAHARGDAGAFLGALSSAPGDRGLPLQELAKVRYGRSDLPISDDPQMIGEARGKLLAESLVAHLVGAPGKGGQGEGLGIFTAGRFFSDSSVPSPAYIDPEADPEEAARALIGETLIDPIEAKGARLSPWPAESGYLLTSTGRPLAAFDTDAEGRIRPFIDNAVADNQMQVLLPKAASTTRSLLDFVFPGWPALHYDPAGRTINFVLDASIVEPELLLLHQDGAGRRTIRRKVKLLPGEDNQVGDLPKTAEAERAVLVLRGRYAGGDPLLWELTLPGGAQAKETIAAVPAPYVAPAKEEFIEEPSLDDEDDDDDAPLLPPLELDVEAPEGDAEEAEEPTPDPESTSPEEASAEPD